VLSRLSATGQSELAWFADGSRELEPLDAAMLTELSDVVARATEDFERYEHARALERTERFFWSFCDDYLELVKLRAYGETVGNMSFTFAETMSARVTLATAVRVFLRLFAPFLPFVTEEVWSWFQSGSIHRTEWPSEHSVFIEAQHLFAELAPGSVLLTGLAEGFDPEAPYLVLSRVRRAKTEAKTSMKTPVAKLRVTGDPEIISQIAQARADLLCATGATEIELVTDPAQEETLVEVELAL
jgi:valyl-tRNA synthetase